MWARGSFVGVLMVSDANGSETKRALAEAHASVLAGLTPGTILLTREGEAPVEWIEAGDEVLTRDRGFVPILWVNRIKLARNDLRSFPDYAPVLLKADCIERGTPAQSITVSPRQLVLVRSPLAELDYGSTEVLMPALSIGTQADPVEMSWDTRVSYAQVLLKNHQTLNAEGLWVGSLFTGTLGLDAPSDCPLACQLETARMQASRPILTVDEGRALMQAIWKAQMLETVFDQDDHRETG